MIEAKEKAKELVEKLAQELWDKPYNKLFRLSKSAIKQCALIAVDEILEAFKQVNSIYKLYPVLHYWQEVRDEIEKL